MLVEGHRVPGTRLFARKDVPTMEILRIVGPDLERLYHESRQGEAPSLRRLRDVMDRYFHLDDERDTSGDTTYVREFRETRRPAKLGVNEKS